LRHCDGFFFRGKEIAVVGGGDSAMEEALFLTALPPRSRCCIAARASRLQIMLDRVHAHPQIVLRPTPSSRRC